MKIIVAVVGRPRHVALGAAAQDYEQRAAHYWPLQVREVKEEPSKSGSPDKVREREGERLLAETSPGTSIVACDPGGTEMSSEAFSAWLQQERERGVDVCFMIGGAFGLSDQVRTAARTRLSLAPWTLPHELARVVLAEQLYRAGTLVRREPYHK